MRPDMTLAELRALPVDERSAVLNELWDELEDGRQPTITPELSAELARRWTFYRANQVCGFTWAQIKAMLPRF